MKAETVDIEGLAIITPLRHEDARGYFCEVFKERWFRENVADIGFVQDNQSFSERAGTVRGLHYQTAPNAQGKLVRCLGGAIFDVAVDIRVGSPSFGRWFGTALTAENARQLWIPPGFAHGFATLEPDTVVHYKVTAPWSREDEHGLLWNDPEIGVAWPVDGVDAILADKDRLWPALRQIRPISR